MTMLPLRDFGKLGVITDADPYDLPANAFTFAKNARFSDNKITRGNIFRSLANTIGTPILVTGYEDPNGVPRSIYVDDQGHAREFPAGTLLSPTGYVPTTNPTVKATTTTLNNVVYVNRPERKPWYRSKSVNTAFTPLAGEWGQAWRAGLIRSVAGVLVALNILEGGTTLPNRVRWSDFVLFDQPAAVWNAAPTNSAGANDLAEMQGDIIDACELRDRLYIYSKDECWVMDYIGGNDMFQFDKAFDFGSISANCSVELDNLQYVFGDNDIRVHDGTSAHSIAQGKVREFIYRTMNKSKSHLFFAVADKKQGEVIFCYCSNDPYVVYPSNMDGCNRAAVYNIAAGTWSFYDMPLVTCAGQARPSVGLSFEEATTKAEPDMTWENVGGSWASAGGDSAYNLIFGNLAGPGFTSAFRTFASYESTSSGGNIDLTVNNGAYLEIGGVDLDEIRASLRGYKLVSSIYPQMRLDSDAKEVDFTVGVTDHPSRPIEWQDPQTFSDQWYKLDYNVAGRYLAMKIQQHDYTGFTLTGADVDVTLLGEY